MGYRCRAYPDQAQQALLNRTFGCIRVVWNRTLADRQRLWCTEGKGLSYAASDAALTAMKKDPGLAFLAEVSSVPLQQTLRHQQGAFTALFAKRAHYPRFKSRRSRQAAHYTRSAFTMRDGVLRLARTNGPLRFVWSWPEVDITSLNPTMVVVARESDGRWYVTFARHLERKARSLARYQQRLARCQAGSANRAKAKAKVARTHRKVRDARRDFLHRASTDLVRDNDVIVIEGLAVKSMVRNRHLARAISSSGWGEFRRQLEYKCQRYGRQLVVIDRWYPSSKTCSACGHVLAKQSLSTRTWQCPSCGARHDRDLNAAKNILAAGQAVTACGAGVSHSGASRVQSAVKQEPRPVTAGIPIPRGRE